MKKWITILLTLTFVVVMVGCNKNSMDYIISNKPSVTGIVKEVQDQYVLMYAETAEGYPKGSYWEVPLDVENPDSYTDLSVGDEIVVYYDGSAMETDPLQIGTVYAITLKTPANRTENTENTIQKEEESWSEQDIIDMFYNSRETEWIYKACVVIPDFASDRVGAVLFWDRGQGTSQVAFFDSEGYFQQCGVYAEMVAEPEFTYLGDGTVTFKLKAENGKTYNYMLTISIEGNCVNFEATDDLVK